MIKHPSSRAERIRLKQLYERKENTPTAGRLKRRLQPQFAAEANKERERNETDPEDVSSS